MSKVIEVTFVGGNTKVVSRLEDVTEPVVAIRWPIIPDSDNNAISNSGNTTVSDSDNNAVFNSDNNTVSDPDNTTSNSDNNNTTSDSKDTTVSDTTNLQSHADIYSLPTYSKYFPHHYVPTGITEHTSMNPPSWWNEKVIIHKCPPSGHINMNCVSERALALPAL